MNDIETYLLYKDRAKNWYKEAKEFFLNYISLSKDKDDVLYLKDSSYYIQIPDFENIYLDFDDYKLSGYREYGLKCYRDYIKEIIKDKKKNGENNITIFDNVENADQFIKLIEKHQIYLSCETPETIVKRTIFCDENFFNSVPRHRFDDKDNQSNQIIIFTRIIKKFLEKSKNKLEDIIKPIYIYSIFTFFIKYLHLWCNETYRRDYKSALVNESLALYLAKEYCILNNLKYEFLIEKAKKYSPTVYPFSGFKYIKNKEHFNNIFENSLRDFDYAFKKIFEDAWVKFDPYDSIFSDEMPLYIYIINFRNGFEKTLKLWDEYSCF